jgi:hypothetical protein
VKPRTAPIVWALLAAIVVNIVIFDLLVIETDDPGLGDLLLAGGLGLAAATVVMLVATFLIRRRSG